MADIRVERMAQVLVEYSLKIKKRDRFLINGPLAANPLIQEVFRLGMRRGAFVDVVAIFPGINRICMDEAHDHQLAQPTPLEKLRYAGYNKILTIVGGGNTKEMTSVPAATLREFMKGRKRIRRLFMEKMGVGALDWCGTLYPTQADAQEAHMSLEEYERFVYDACWCDQSNPVSKWMKICQRQAAIVRFLNGTKTIHVKAKDTDLTARVGGRIWENCAGRQNFPDGEVFTGPIENSVNGKIRFSFPGICLGKEIEDIRLEFRDGKVVKASAAKGSELLHQLIKVDPGAAYVGELAIGTNCNIKRFTRNMLFDEKIGGTIHMALGAGIPRTGSQNKSSLHWDMLCDMRAGGVISADGKAFYRNGRFLV